MNTEIEYYGETIPLRLEIGSYRNGRTAIEAVDPRNCAAFGTLTVNIQQAPLAEDEIIVKTYSENEAWVPQVLAAFPEAFVATGGVVASGFVACPVYKFVPAKVANTGVAV